MHHIVFKFKKKIRLRRQGGIDPLTKILRTLPPRSDAVNMGDEIVPEIVINNTVNLFFLNSNHHFANFEP